MSKNFTEPTGQQFQIVFSVQVEFRIDGEDLRVIVTASSEQGPFRTDSITIPLWWFRSKPTGAASPESLQEYFNNVQKAFQALIVPLLLRDVGLHYAAVLHLLAILGAFDRKTKLADKIIQIADEHKRVIIQCQEILKLHSDESEIVQKAITPRKGRQRVGITELCWRLNLPC